MVKVYKPTSPGRRLHSVTDYSVLTKKVKAHKSLVVSKRKQAGRNNSGKITVRHQGGGARKKIRVLDFSRSDKKNVPAVVKTIEYDPTRTAFIALLAYKDGAKRYILAPQGMKAVRVGSYSIVFTTAGTFFLSLREKSNTRIFLRAPPP
jgi:large subunit ribosomal protein L2